MKYIAMVLAAAMAVPLATHAVVKASTGKSCRIVTDASGKRLATCVTAGLNTDARVPGKAPSSAKPSMAASLDCANAVLAPDKLLCLAVQQAEPPPEPNRFGTNVG